MIDMLDLCEAVSWKLGVELEAASSKVTLFRISQIQVLVIAY
jgi:hypothetical protein